MRIESKSEKVASGEKAKSCAKTCAAKAKTE
jgi:hypothetical protein